MVTDNAQILKGGPDSLNQIRILTKNQNLKTIQGSSPVPLIEEGAAGISRTPSRKQPGLAIWPGCRVNGTRNDYIDDKDDQGCGEDYQGNEVVVLLGSGEATCLVFLPSTDAPTRSLCHAWA